jgi:predicted Zn finger-like uncharacterized protein
MPNAAAPIQVRCPNCPTRLRVPADQIGKMTRCPKCGTQFLSAEAPPPEALPMEDAPAKRPLPLSPGWFMQGAPKLPPSVAAYGRPRRYPEPWFYSCTSGVAIAAAVVCAAVSFGLFMDLGSEVNRAKGTQFEHVVAASAGYRIAGLLALDFAIAILCGMALVLVDVARNVRAARPPQ